MMPNGVDFSCFFSKGLPEIASVALHACDLVTGTRGLVRILWKILGGITFDP